MQIHEDVELVPVEKIVPYHNNPKNHPDEQIDYIASLIKEFGFVQPLVVDPEYEIIIGHGRYYASKKLDLDKVPCIQKDDITESKARMLRIADNKSNESAWEEDSLGVEIEMLYEDDEDLELTGFSEDRIDEFLDDDIDSGLPGDIAEQDPDLDVEEFVNPGDVIELGDHLLICGDAESPDSYAIAEDFFGRFHMTFTSPPYNAGDTEELSGNTHMEESKYKNDDDDLEADEWVDLVFSVLSRCMNHSEYQFFNIQQLAGNKFAFIDFLNKIKNHFVDMMVWDKQSAAPQMVDNVMNSRFEYVVITSPKPRPTKQIKIADFRGDVPNVYEGSPQRNNSYSEVHSATFPLDFANYIVYTFTQKGNKVIDPFAGTGTTLIACDELDRRCCLVEVDPYYCSVIVDRWKKYSSDGFEVIDNINS